ncbi:MAG: lytic transglycosylase domain-containing protein [Trebonia sp.]
MTPRGVGASSLAEAIDGLPQNNSVALLEQERQTLVDMSSAVRTLSVAAKPATVSPSDMAAVTQTASSGNSSSTSTGSGVTTVSAPAPDPGTAQSIAYNMLPSFGFSQSSQWGCLLNIWNRESGWNYQAENPYSGAYGIPQALPGSKMASAGADWQTNPATQIKWGLGYIQSIYGTPCGAWDFELANGYY